MTSEDFESSLANEVRRMAMAGVSDDVLREFIDARRRGDTDHAECMLKQAQQQSRPPRPALTPVEKLRVAALRPVANAVDSSTLYSYIGIIWPITNEIVRSHEDPTYWASDSFVDAIAQSLVRVAMEQLQVKVEDSA
jgi:hypothetical protein